MQQQNLMSKKKLIATPLEQQGAPQTTLPTMGNMLTQAQPIQRTAPQTTLPATGDMLAQVQPRQQVPLARNAMRGAPVDAGRNSMGSSQQQPSGMSGMLAQAQTMPSPGTRSATPLTARAASSGMATVPRYDPTNGVNEIDRARLVPGSSMVDGQDTWNHDRLNATRAVTGMGHMDYDEIKAAEEGILESKYRSANESAINKVRAGIGSSDLTTTDFRDLANRYGENADIYDPTAAQQQQTQGNQNTLYAQMMQNATGEGMTAGQRQLQAQLMRGENQARSTAMQAALSSGASPAAAARAATMSSDQYTRGTNEQIAATGMAERLANLDTAAQFGTTQQQIANQQYQTSLVNQASAINAEKSLGLDLAGVSHGALMDIGGLAAQNRAIDEQVSQQNKDRNLKKWGAAITGGGSFLMGK